MRIPFVKVEGSWPAEASTGDLACLRLSRPNSSPQKRHIPVQNTRLTTMFISSSFQIPFNKDNKRTADEQFPQSLEERETGEVVSHQGKGAATSRGEIQYPHAETSAYLHSDAPGFEKGRDEH